jgi:hypothetical protein
MAASAIKEITTVVNGELISRTVFIARGDTPNLV